MKPPALAWITVSLAFVMVLMLAGHSSAAGDQENTDRFGHQALPTDQLEKEHEVTLKMADAADQMAAKLRAGEEVSRERLADMYDFFINFVDACHHGKEEQYYFPVALIAKPDLAATVKTLELQHDIGKSLISGIGRSLDIWNESPETARREAADDLTAYASLLRRHIDLESGAFMKAAEAAFSPEQRSLVRAGFHYVEAEQLGEGFHEKYHNLAMKLLNNAK